MYKRTAVLFLIVISSLLPIVAISTLAASQDTNILTAPVSPPISTATPPYLPPPTGAGIAASRSDRALLNTDYLMVYGPDTCSPWGDPFSPITPTWTATSWLDPLDFQGIYTYHFRIRIPADYPDNILRVELFDPDSINQATNSAWVIHSRTAQLFRPTQFPPTPVLMNCTSANQKNVCIIPTGESILVGDLNVTIDHINPNWFMRVDDNRGGGPSGVCSQPATYTPAYNTQTRYTLSYYIPTGNAASEQVILATYTGQTGDGIRDNGDHDTDLRWVSPGGIPSFDQSTFVPAEQGSFEVNLVQDTPNLPVDPLSGERVLYLDVTTLSGASKNGFAIWAGPDDYVNTTPSAVNARNLSILNNPGLHYNRGIQVEAINYLPRESLISTPIDFPLVELGPEFAGQTITVSLFDPDAGAKPPVMFFMDSLAFTPNAAYSSGFDPTQTDWGVSFGGEIDPLGRCFDESSSYSAQCNNSWINPAYTITLPSEQECDSPETCMPFYGGKLWTRYQGGMNDRFVWHVSVPERPLLDITLGCSAFPIGTDETIRSVLAPDDPSTAQNQWRDDFDYPNPGVDYYAYPNHQPNTPLLNAKPGYLYNIQNGASSGGKGWLAWNQCMVADSSALEYSLTWPGNSKDYSPSGGNCVVNGEQMYRFAGFMEFGDNTDTSMHTGDWVSVSTGSTGSYSFVDTLEEHVDLDRTLRVIVYDDTIGYSAYRIKRFALMRLLGFSLNLGGGESFILAEFIGWDDSCGQVESAPIPINNITLTGPNSGMVNSSYTFTATAAPVDATTPITTVWSATDLDAITQTGGIETSQSFQWTTSGPKTIIVTAQNQNSALITATHQITILTPLDLVIGPVEWVTTPPITAGQPVTFRTTVTNTGDVDLNSQVFVDLFINPTEIYDEYIPVGQSSGSASLPGLAAQSSQVVTLTAVAGFPLTPTTHTVYAMVDSLQAVNEANETNNISPPLFVSGILPPPQPPLSVTLSGPSVGKVGEPLTFTATVSPLTAVQPISYTWWLADLPPVFQTNGLSDTLTAAWSTPGTKNISVIAANHYGQVTAHHSFEIVEQKLLFLPLVAKPACEQHTAALTLDYEPTAVSVNDPITITVTLENVGCANIGLPKYTLTATPSLVDPASPEPIIHYLGLGPGDSDSVEFMVTAVSPGSFTLNANASFEVHLGYPGPAYWGTTAASRQITINP